MYYYAEKCMRDQRRQGYYNECIAKQKDIHNTSRQSTKNTLQLLKFKKKLGEIEYLYRKINSISPREIFQKSN